MRVLVLQCHEYLVDYWLVSCYLCCYLLNPIWIVMLNLRSRLSMCNYAHPYYLSFINEFLATNSTGDIRAHQEKA